MRVVLGSALLTLGSLGTAVVSVAAGHAAVTEAFDPALSGRDPAALHRDDAWARALDELLRARLERSVERQGRGDSTRRRHGRCGGIACGGCGGRSGAGKADETSGTVPPDSEMAGSVCTTCGFGLWALELGSPMRGRRLTQSSVPLGVEPPEADGGEAVLMTEGSARVQGFVVDEQTGAGLGALTLELSSEGRLVAVAVTDESGAFEFSGLQSGTFVVSSASAAEGGQPWFESAPLELTVGGVASDLVLDVGPLAAAVLAAEPATN